MRLTPGLVLVSLLTATLQLGCRTTPPPSGVAGGDAAEGVAPATRLEGDAAGAVASAAPVAPVDAGPPTPATYRGRAVHYLDAATACPRVGLGTRSEHACLRIGLDDDHTTAQVDRQRHRITLRNDTSYADEQIIGDVVLPGWAESDAGRTPVGVHTVLRKKGNEIHTKVYSHVVVHDKAKTVTLEDFEIAFSDGKTETIVLTREQAEKAVRDPGLAARAAGFLLEVKDNLAKADAQLADKPVADLTIAAGIGPAADKMLRAQLFKSGADVELRFTALSNLVPKYIAQRDTFLYGVEATAAMAAVKKRGLESGETMTIAWKGGKGTVTLGGPKAASQTSDLPEAPNCLRDFLQTAAVGMLLAHQAHLDGG